MKMTKFEVEGRDLTPDGYRDHLLYHGLSWWEMFKAVRAARRNDMHIIVRMWT